MSALEIRRVVCDVCGSRVRDDRCTNDTCPSEIAIADRNGRAETLRILGSLGALVLIWLVYYAALQALANDCEASGGHVAQVYGGRSGIVCIEPEPHQ